MTVLMPVYNGARYLGEAIESVLAQTYPDFELLVVDDGSADQSPEIVRSFREARIRLIRNEGHLGLVPTLNRGLELAQGEFIARQDADDRSHPQRLDRQVRFLQSHARVMLVGSQARVIDELSRPVGVLDRPQQAASIRWHHCFDNSFIHSSVMIRRAAVEGEGKGYEALAHCEDYALWSRLALEHPTANLPMRLVDYRRHPASVYGTVTPDKAQRSAWGNRLIIERNTEALFGAGGCSPEECALLAGFRTGLSLPQLESFLELFQRLLGRYVARHPEAKRSSDFRRTLARQYDEIAYKLSPATRRAAIRIYASAMRHDPRLSWSLSWPRALSLALLGKEGRQHLRKMALEACA